MDISELLDQAEDGYLIPCRTENGEVDLFAKSAWGDTLLHVAVGRRNVDEVQYLVLQGLDINARGEFGETPLCAAADKGDVLMFRLIVRLGGDCTIPNYSGVLPDEVLKKRCAE